jgi:hypothetical protein
VTLQAAGFGRDYLQNRIVAEFTLARHIGIVVELRASAAAPSDAQIDRFRKMLQRAGRGRIRVRVEIIYGDTLATLFEGVFAAAMRQKEEKCLEN